MLLNIIIAYLLVGGFRVAHTMRKSNYFMEYRMAPMTAFATFYVLGIIIWGPMLIKGTFFPKVKKD